MVPIRRIEDYPKQESGTKQVSCQKLRQHVPPKGLLNFDGLDVICLKLYFVELFTAMKFYIMVVYVMTPCILESFITPINNTTHHHRHHQ
jgi:hypothetical protein